MPSRRHSSAIFSSPRNPSKTIRTFSSAEYCLRVRRRISRTVASTAALVSSLMVYSLASLILTRNSHLSFSPYFVSLVLKRNNVQRLPRSFQEELLDFVEYLVMKAEQQEKQDWVSLSLSSAMRDMEDESVSYSLSDL